jgi:hypothetical protein
MNTFRSEFSLTTGSGWLPDQLMEYYRGDSSIRDNWIKLPLSCCLSILGCLFITLFISTKNKLYFSLSEESENSKNYFGFL